MDTFGHSQVRPYNERELAFAALIFEPAQPLLFLRFVIVAAVFFFSLVGTGKVLPHVLLIPRPDSATGG